MEKKGRSAGRNRVMLSADLITSIGEAKVRVRDVSATGAKLVSNAPVETGSDILLRHRSLFAAGVIKWARDGEIGIEFYRQQNLDAEPASLNAA